MIALSVRFVYSFVFKGLLAYLAIVHNDVSFMHQCLDFGEFSQLSPSFHRAVAHSGEVARYFQAQGFTIGELSECAQEAINAPTKKDVAQFSFRGSHKKQNLGCLKRNWAFSDPLTMEYAE